MTQEKLLVIKLGALGDFIQALGPMAAIRKHHTEAHITLLTTVPFKDFANSSGYFDAVRLDARPKFTNIRSWVELKNFLNDGSFSRVYDLQNNDRTSLYFRLFNHKHKPEWVGVAAGASHRNISPERTAGHAFDGHVQTLALAGITDIKIDTLEWITADISSFPLRKPYILLVPGSAPEHPGKRWPAEKYGLLAGMLHSAGFQPVILGTAAEKNVAEEIARACPEALDLTGQTSLAQIVGLARTGGGAIGNDTGPMHLIGAAGCPSLVLLSQHSNPLRHAPKGSHVNLLQEGDLKNLEAEKVIEHFRTRAHLS